MFTLTFSILSDGQRVPLIINGQEVTLQVEAPTKTATYQHPEVIAFCESQGGDCRIRRVV